MQKVKRARLGVQGAIAVTITTRQAADAPYGTGERALKTQPDFTAISCFVSTAAKCAH